MKARYDAIYRDIRDTIEDGTYPFQAFLPSEAELTRYYACSHNTLRRALGLLREQGYVDTFLSVKRLMNVIGCFVFQSQMWPLMVINCHGLFDHFPGLRQVCRTRE